jgi:hypothetical protein
MGVYESGRSWKVFVQHKRLFGRVFKLREGVKSGDEEGSHL